MKSITISMVDLGFPGVGTRLSCPLGSSNKFGLWERPGSPNLNISLINWSVTIFQIYQPCGVWAQDGATEIFDHVLRETAPPGEDLCNLRGYPVRELPCEKALVRYTDLETLSTGGYKEGRAPFGVQFFQFHAVLVGNWPNNNFLQLPLELAPPPHTHTYTHTSWNRGVVLLTLHTVFSFTLVKLKV